MRLTALRIAGDPAAWAALGFAVAGGRLRAGGVTIELAGPGAGEGILAWSVDGLAGGPLPAFAAGGEGPEEHPNGVCAVDHVVALAGDLEAAIGAFEQAGMSPRRIREAGGGLRQAFYVLDTALLELAGPAEGETGLRFWGLTLVASDLDALAARLGPLLGEPRPAVQPGRRIATLRREAGLGLPVAFMSVR